MDYKSTMNLPQTEFPMRASLATREPEWLKYWEEIDVYGKTLEATKDAPPFILHDGPPYANGHIHMGTAFNKVFKDLIVKYKTMRGFYSPYVPGWDCHGQPIEHQVEKNLGPERMAEISRVDLRALCRDYAMRFVGVQSAEFQRLGVRGDFERPYLTLRPEYEAGNVRIFAELYRRGMIYKGSKPIHWCTRCKTALAEAEIEYGDETSDSIYVGFELIDPPDVFAAAGLPVSILIWTTTPWTLPANVAVTLAEDASYVGVVAGGKVLVFAEELVSQVAEVAGWERIEYVCGDDGEPARMRGSELAGLRYHQPIHADLEGVVITGPHVELSTGTGAVHTAPGHGEEDWLVGREFGLPSLMPVDDNGVFDGGGGRFAGMHVYKANPAIIDYLREEGSLLHAGTTSHSYPHCWRCKQKVIFRATEQWFVSMDHVDEGRPLREGALEAIGTVEWIPGWSVNRIRSMVADRPDWCISRQRAWGVPIPVFTCAACGETVANDETFEAVIRLFETEGADAWFIKDPSEYLPAGVTCPRCGGTTLTPEDDIVDVWWESGVSHTSVLDNYEELHRPAELYLEGSDQHRGWFQSALLTSVGAYNAAPYERVLTHGFIVDGDGRKMSKSLGNVISPLDVIEKSGADIIRLWAAAADYSQDVSISDEILDRTSEAYRRMRNTFRFLLSNLYDYEPSMAVEWEQMPEIDRYAMVKLADLVERVTRAYDEWKFHQVYRAVFDYCVVDLSSFYFDVLKDRLYSDAAGSLSRRSAQTVLSHILGALVRLVAPVLTFTSEEVWHFMPEKMREDLPSVQLAGWPVVEIPSAEEAARLRDSYRVVLEVRDVVTKALEDARNAKVVNKSQEAAIALTAPTDALDELTERGLEALAEMFIVSAVQIAEGDQISVAVEPASGEKCPRCWNYREIGVDPARPELCGRCAGVLADG
ncbi:MAG: isoleucine--tRNA ligase [Anaerosomatales bacterium]|nr:isoleucine--tRNA ligase [Anaerosomatales bacterium]MDT8433267.1 isoleucine--tRNA ligase [Anaerosomatales bacterium]